tara:strand:+ start:482 stop:757 length:276 start_codon:yes stop_codon:yes gene_type:complete
MYNLNKINEIYNNINIIQKKTLHINDNDLLNMRFKNINYFLNSVKDEIDLLNSELNNNLYLNKEYIDNEKKINDNENNSIKFLTSLYSLKN